MTQPDGIDMSRSGWTNPENFQRAPRPDVPVKAVKACEAKGPNGWVCDLPPGHMPADSHWADNGSGEGLTWLQHYADVSTLGTPPDQPRVIPARVEVVALDGGAMAAIESIATKALESQSPAAWAVALDKILEVCHRG